MSMWNKKTFEELKSNYVWNLELLEETHKKWSVRYCNVKCYCWNIWNTQLLLVSKWKIKSCWCINKTNKLWKNNPNYRHWLRNSKFRWSWNHMIQRCTNKNRKDYKHYWWRWITICEKWKVFKWFIDDMYSSRKEWLELDRIDNNKNYCKENCRWATRKEQNNNKRNNHKLTFMWKTKTLSERSDETWISYWNISNRINAFWWSIKDTLTIKVNRDERYIYKKNKKKV